MACPYAGMTCGLSFTRVGPKPMGPPLLDKEGQGWPVNDKSAFHPPEPLLREEGSHFPKHLATRRRSWPES